MTFSDDTSENYDIVIGADGIRSRVRAAAMDDVQPVYGGQLVWRSITPVELPDPVSVQFWLGDGCFFGLCSLGGGRTYGFGNVTHNREHDAVEGRLGRLRDRFRGFGTLCRSNR